MAVIASGRKMNGPGTVEAVAPAPTTQPLCRKGVLWLPMILPRNKRCGKRANRKGDALGAVASRFFRNFESFSTRTGNGEGGVTASHAKSKEQRHGSVAIRRAVGAYKERPTSNYITASRRTSSSDSSHRKEASALSVGSLAIPPIFSAVADNWFGRYMWIIAIRLVPFAVCFVLTATTCSGGQRTIRTFFVPPPITSKSMAADSHKGGVLCR